MKTGMQKYQLPLLSVLSGLILSTGWTQYGLAPLLFVAFIPLLVVEDQLFNNTRQRTGGKVLLNSYIAFLTWNVVSTWWIYNASDFGMISAALINSMFMATIFWLFHITKKRLGNKIGYISLVIYWVAFEYLHLNWELSWPWLNIGNGFSNNIKLIQWYENTGVLGGTLWVLLANTLAFIGVKKYINSNSIKELYKTGIVMLLVLGIPIAASMYRYHTYTETNNPVDIVVIQPNIDPYNEKFDGSSLRGQLEKILDLAKSKADEKVDYFVAPETALPGGIWLRNLPVDYPIVEIKKMLKSCPDAAFVTGLSAFKKYDDLNNLSKTARKAGQSDIYYDSYNSAVQIDTSINFQIYHKSKLVPGVEEIPFIHTFSFMKQLSIDMGGTSGTLGKQEERTVFNKDSISIAPVICYESVYGEYVSEFIKNGAQLIFVVTNDGWWDNTPGHRQHLSYSRLRAIETRRSIARSANTGISCFINQKGDLIQPTNWWEEDVIRTTINANDTLTTYTIWGNYLGRVAAFISILLLLYAYTRKIYAKN